MQADSFHCEPSAAQMRKRLLSRHSRALGGQTVGVVSAALQVITPLIGDEDGLERETIAGSIAHLLHIARGGIGVKPECRHAAIYTPTLTPSCRRSCLQPDAPQRSRPSRET